MDFQKRERQLSYSHATSSQRVRENLQHQMSEFMRESGKATTCLHQFVEVDILGRFIAGRELLKSISVSLLFSRDPAYCILNYNIFNRETEERKMLLLY